MKNIKYIKQVYYILAFMVFLMGVTIYLFFRDINNMILLHYFSNLSFLDTFYIPVKIDSIWSYMLFYNLPDGLWCLSALLFIRITWIFNARWRVIYSGIFIFIAFFYEFLQMFESIPGTFDPLDLVFIGTFAFLEGLIFNIYHRRRII